MKLDLDNKGTFKLALAQMLVQGGEKEANLSRAEKYIEEAAESGAQVIVLPECLDLGWTHPSSLKEAEPIPEGMPYKRLAAAAYSSEIYVCAGLTERKGQKIYNSAVLINPEGKLELLHRKINELSIGHSYYALGDRLSVVETEFGVFGIMICADGFASGQVLSRSLCYMGADIILSPSAWAVRDDTKFSDKQPYGEIWRRNYKPVAKEYQVWIAGVSNVGEITAGPWRGRKCIGSSLVFNPNGSEVLQGPYGVAAETIIYTTITPLKRPFKGDDWKNRKV